MIRLIRHKLLGAIRQSAVAGMVWEWRDPLYWPQWLHRGLVLLIFVATLVVGVAAGYWLRLADWHLLQQQRAQQLSQHQEAQQHRARYIRLAALRSRSQQALAQLNDQLGTNTPLIERVTAVASRLHLHIDQLVPADTPTGKRLALIVSGSQRALLTALLEAPLLKAAHVAAFELETPLLGQPSLWLELDWPTVAGASSGASATATRNALAAAKTSALQPESTSDTVSLLLEATRLLTTQARLRASIDKLLQGVSREPVTAQTRHMRVGAGVALGAFTFRGRLSQSGEHFGLLSGPDDVIYRVKSGDRLGVEQALVDDISAEGVSVYRSRQLPHSDATDESTQRCVIGHKGIVP